MIGIVLCGGQSTRMGTDKGLLLKDQHTWSELAFNKLKSLNIDVFVSVNNEQSIAYARLFSQLLTDDNLLMVQGPLLGLLTAHSKFPNHDLLILACDMPDVNFKLLQDLVKTSHSHDHEACVYLVEGKPQPLCGIYSAQGLQRIFNLYQRGALQKFSMMYILDLLDTYYLPANPEQLSLFTNYNSQEDIEKSKD